MKSLTIGDLNLKWIDTADGKPEGLPLVRSISYRSALNKSAVLTVEWVYEESKLKALSKEKIPRKIELTWKNTVYFRGNLQQLEFIGRNKVYAAYGDLLWMAEEQFVESQTMTGNLSELLSQICAAISKQLSAAFHEQENFLDRLLAFPIEYKSAYDILKLLSQFYGFYFIHRPSSSVDKIHFIKPKKSVNIIPAIIKNEQLLRLKEIRSNFTYSANQVQIEAPRSESSAGGKMIQLLRESMDFQSHSPVSQIRFPSATRAVFESIQKLLPDQVAIKSQDQDQIEFFLTEPLVRTGDRFIIKDADVSVFPIGSSGQIESLENDPYLVKEIAIEVHGPHPRIRVHGLKF